MRVTTLVLLLSSATAIGAHAQTASTTGSYPTRPIPYKGAAEVLTDTAPGKLPPAVINQLSAEVARILALPAVRERLMALVLIPSPSAPEELHTLLRTEIETRKKIFKDFSVQPQ